MTTSSKATPIEQQNVLLEKKDELTSEDKKLFRYFGEGSKILPPYRILNPHRITIDDRVAIREHSHINAFQDLSFLTNYIDESYAAEFDKNDYLYDSEIIIDREVQIGRFFFVSCTNSIHISRNVVLSERIFVGDNNHSFSHMHVPIVQQPNKPGKPIVIGQGSWIGVGACLLGGTSLGKNSVVGANSVCQGEFPSYSVIAPPKAELLFRRFNPESEEN
jgi:acetyltransferase-like isoleucine patch superfamily enzyme